MLKTLLKKQLLGLNYSFFYDAKKKKLRSKASSITFIVFYALLMVAIGGGTFGMLCYSICAPLAEVNMGWLYFAILGLMSVALGVFGSVFNTYSSLYLSKDNDLLLSMPIPTRYILITRLAGVYLMGLMFSALVMLPAVIVYLFVTPFSFAALLGCIMLMLVISAVVLVLSCVLGWVVAVISLKLKHKSFITVLASLAFLAAYYLIYFKAVELLEGLIENATTIGESIKGIAYPIYLLGRMGEGNLAAILILTAIAVAVTAVTFAVLSHGFIKIATSSGSSAKTKYKERTARQSGVSSALLRKELYRFTASSNYMLNCGLGTILMPAMAIFMLVGGFAPLMKESVGMIFGGSSDEVLTVIIVAVLCMLGSMNDMSTASVSLEGKSIWIAQSMPVDPWLCLKAKLKLHLLMTAVPMLLCSIVAVAVFRPAVVFAILLVIIPLEYVLLFACFGLFLDLKKPNLNWTNEIVPIKQSLNILMVIFGGWLYTLVVAGGYFLLRSCNVSATVYLAVTAVVTGAICALLLIWIKNKGSKIYSNL